MLSEITESQRDKYYIPIFELSKIMKLREAENGMMVAKDWGKSENGRSTGISFQLCRMNTF